jgi:hypothetical protein
MKVANPAKSFPLFLPRVETHHLEKSDTDYVDYITEAFYKAGYGVVSKIYPLLKTDTKTGGKYYSAVVYFERWFYSDVVYNFLSNLESTKMGNKFIHNPVTGKYWFVQKHVDNREARAAAKRAEQTQEERQAQEERRVKREAEDAQRRKQIVLEIRRKDAEEECNNMIDDFGDLLAIF